MTSLGMMTAEQVLEIGKRHAAGRITAEEVVERAVQYMKNDRTTMLFAAKLPSDVVSELKKYGFDVLIDGDGTTVDWSAGKGLQLVPARGSKKGVAKAGKA